MCVTNPAILTRSLPKQLFFIIDMKANRATRILLIIVSLILGSGIIYYYWTVNDLRAIKYLPLNVVFMSFGYVLMQILKRYLFATNNWWDWLYYLGLLGVVLPLFIANESNQWFFHLLTDYASFFLLIPMLMDAIVVLKQKNS